MDSLLSSFRNIRLLPTLVVIRHKRTSDELDECELGQSKVTQKVARFDKESIQQCEPIEPVAVDESHVHTSHSLSQISVDDRTDSIPFPHNMKCDDTNQHQIIVMRPTIHPKINSLPFRPDRVIVDMSGISF